MTTPVIYQYSRDDDEYPISFTPQNEHRMVNATEMISAFPNKRMNDFLRLNQTKDFISALDKKLITGIPVIKTTAGRYGGTWMHEKLALKFAAWLSVEFELWVYDKIEELLKLGVSYLRTTGFNQLSEHMFHQVQKNNSKAMGAKEYGIEKDRGKIIKYFKGMFEAYVGMTPSRLTKWATEQGIPLKITRQGGRETLRYLAPEQASVISFIDNAIASNPKLTSEDVYELIKIGKQLESSFVQMSELGIGDTNDLKYLHEINI